VQSPYASPMHMLEWYSEVSTDGSSHLNPWS
jgi:hypothetical protein